MTNPAPSAEIADLDAVASVGSTQGAADEGKPVLLLFSNCSVKDFASLLPRVSGIGDRIAVRWFFIGFDTWEKIPKSEIDRIELVWEMVHNHNATARTEMQALVPPNARRIRFPALTSASLWPFYVADKSGRTAYGHGDRLCLMLREEFRNARPSDDEVVDRYVALAQQYLTQMRRLLDIDRMTLKSRDAESDVQIGDVVTDLLLSERLFTQMGRITLTPFRLLLQRLMTATFDRSWGDPDIMQAELSDLLAHYRVVDQAEWPVSPAVASGLGLTWYDPDYRYRWQDNRWTFRDWVIRYARDIPHVKS